MKLSLLLCSTADAAQQQQDPVPHGDQAQWAAAGLLRFVAPLAA